jgi:hypothetical protein
MSVRARVFAISVVGAVVLSACGGSTKSISTAERARLLPLVERVRRAAESRDRPAARKSLTDLQHAVSAAVSRGDLSSASATEILAAAAQVSIGLALVPAPTTTSSSTTTPTTDTGQGKKSHHKGKSGKHANDGND